MILANARAHRKNEKQRNVRDGRKGCQRPGLDGEKYDLVRDRVRLGVETRLVAPLEEGTFNYV